MSLCRPKRKLNDFIFRTPQQSEKSDTEKTTATVTTTITTTTTTARNGTLRSLIINYKITKVNHAL